MKQISLFFSILIHSLGSYSQNPSLVLPNGHASQTHFVSFSHNDKYLLSCSEDKTAKVWEVITGRLLYTLSNHTDVVETGNFSPNGNYILTSSRDQSAIVWDMNTGKQLYKISGLAKWGSFATFSPDGNLILTNSIDGNILNLYDSKTGKLKLKLNGHAETINTFNFSRDGKKIISAGYDRTAIIWETATGKIIHKLKEHSAEIEYANFNKDGTIIITTASDSSSCLWETASGKLLHQLKGNYSRIFYGEFSPDNKHLVTASNGDVVIWNTKTGESEQKLVGHSRMIMSAFYNHNGSEILTSSADYTTKLWNAETGILKWTDTNMVGYPYTVCFSKYGKLFATSSKNNIISIIETNSGKVLRELGNLSVVVNSIDFHPKDKNILLAIQDSTLRILDYENGKFSSIIKNKNNVFSYAKYSPDGNEIFASSRYYSSLYNANNGILINNILPNSFWHVNVNYGKTGKFSVCYNYDKHIIITDSETGELLRTIVAQNHISSAQISPDGSLLATSHWDSTARLWNLETGELVQTYRGHTFWLNKIDFSPDGTQLITSGYDGVSILYQVESGKPLRIFKGHSFGVISSSFNSKGNQIVSCGKDDQIRVWDTETGKLVQKFIGHKGNVFNASFLSSDSLLVSISEDNTICLWSIRTGKPIEIFTGQNYSVSNSDSLILISDKSSLILYDVVNRKLVYKTYFLMNNNLLFVDGVGRYDGTEDARKMLYYTCGKDIIDLDQIKDLCWEPGLVEKIMGTNKEPIKAKRLDEISICGNTPLIENIEDDKDQKKFKIKRRGGGIGELAVYINQKEVEKIPVSTLVFTNDEAIVIIDESKYQNYFEAGKENSIQLQARTADLSISSKGAVMPVKTTSKPTTAPNLYAIIAGVSDYKGEKLDLRFAAKDAEDFSNALQESAKALLNIDGKEHVFVTTLLSNKSNSPSKSNISKAFADIKSKAKANDIVVIYLSGHGENFGTESTNFYYLTEDASSFELSGIEKEVAISTNEFAEWLKAIPAGKQVLILDACASGKLAEDILVAMKAGIPSDQIRALDRLNSRTGTFILSGAAANQSAYETSIYGQGLLTYSLLYGMKSGTALKDNQFVDVDKLFQYSADKVKELAAGIGGIQDPVISKPNGGASFDIGKIDETVASKIILALPKPIFTNSKFSNRETDDDNLGLEKAIDDLLNEFASKGKESQLVFTEKSQLPESYKIVGSYQMTNDKITITVRIKKGTVEIQKFELANFDNDKYKLAKAILDRVEMKMK